jgi:hypothetical protein
MGFWKGTNPDAGRKRHSVPRKLRETGGLFAESGTFRYLSNYFSKY